MIPCRSTRMTIDRLPFTIERPQARWSSKRPLRICAMCRAIACGIIRTSISEQTTKATMRISAMRVQTSVRCRTSTLSRLKSFWYRGTWARQRAMTGWPTRWLEIRRLAVGSGYRTTEAHATRRAVGRLGG